MTLFQKLGVVKISSIFFFFCKCSKNIGENSTPINNGHPSIVNIQENLTVQSKLNFKPVDEEFVSKQIGRLNVKKATGHDGISAKILKLAKPVIFRPITGLINLTIECSEFPDNTKMQWFLPYTKIIAIFIRKTIALLVFYLLFQRFTKEQLMNN